MQRIVRSAPFRDGRFVLDSTQHPQLQLQLQLYQRNPRINSNLPSLFHRDPSFRAE